MAWIKISTREVLNADTIITITIQQNRAGTYYIKFSLKDGDFACSKSFERIEECLELFDEICDAMMNNESIDVN